MLCEPVQNFAKVKAMPLDAEFKKHLRSLTREVQENTFDELANYKNELVGKAIATHNAAAVPLAYKNAALHSMELRVRQTIEKYIEAVDIWGIAIDATFEDEMVKEFWTLTSGPNQLQFPPMIFKQTLPAVQQSYSQERGRLAKRLVNEGRNRLRELKMRTIQAKRTAAVSTTNNTFNGPVGNAYINSSVIQTTNNVTITARTLDDIDRLSEENSELQFAALEVRNAQDQGTNMIDKFQKWASLANTVGGLAEKIRQYYPHIASLISHWAK
jgi:hypothetical protein